jgi:hypothetical protein
MKSIHLLIAASMNACLVTSCVAQGLPAMAPASGEGYVYSSFIGEDGSHLENSLGATMKEL